MRRWLLGLASIAVVVVLGRPVGADEEYDAATSRAAEVAAAAKDPLALKRLAADREGPDPWLVVDVLLQKPETQEAARAFAAAYAQRDAVALRAVAARQPREPSGARARLAAAEAKLKDAEAAKAKAAESDGDGPDPTLLAEGAIESLKDVQDLTPGVLRVRWLTQRASALQWARRLRDAAKDLREAGDTATRMGWSRRAAALAQLEGAMARADNDLRAALAAYARLADLEHALGEEKSRALTLADVAEIHLIFGEPLQALDRIDEGLRTLPANGDAVVRATLGARRAEALLGLGRRDDARREIEAALKTIEKDGPSLSLGDACAILGHVLRSLGDREGARSAYTSAKSAYEAAPRDPDAEDDRLRGLAAAAANLAVVLAKAGKHEDAFEELGRARALFLSQGAPSLAARALQGMADVRLLQIAADPRSTEREHWLAAAQTSALGAQTEASAAQDPDGVLYARGNVGQVEEALGHLDEATRMYEDVVREASSRGDTEAVLEYSTALARTRLRKGNASGAIDSVEEGIRCLDGAFGDQGEQTRLRAREWGAELFDLGARAALRLPAEDSLRGVFRFAEKARATILLDALENREVLRTRGISPERELARADAQRAVVEAQRALEAADGSLAAGVAARKRLTEAQHAYAQAVDAIQADARLAANLLYPEPVALEEAQGLLRADEALVIYATAGADAHVIVLTHDKAKPVPLGSAAEARDACRQSMVRYAEAEAKRSWALASTRVLEPVEAVLDKAIVRVFVSPDGHLGLLPFAALRPEKDARQFLLVPSASTFEVLLRSSARRGQGVLGVGLSDYAVADATGVQRGGRGHSNLPQAETEAAAVSDVPLLGKKATERDFFKAVASRPAWSAIHFAVHGVLNRENPSLSALALAPAAPDDGDLTAFELMQHDIRADVAVLAACDSGAGTPVAGEGLVGLTRALFFSGCPRVVASLWNADDDAAREFSVAFHASWKAGAPLDDAVRAAREAVRKNKKWEHPFYWAGWVPWGVR